MLTVADSHPWATFLVPYAANYVIMLGAHLIAVQVRLNHLRLQFPWGKRLGAEYEAQPAAFFLIMAVGLLMSYGLSLLFERVPKWRKVLSTRNRFGILMVATLLTGLGTSLILPDLSKLQLVYFAGANLVLGILTIAWVERLSPQRTYLDFFGGLARLWDNRFLLFLWLRFNIQSRYTQTILGIVWIVALPLATSLVYAVALTQFLKVQFDVPFVSFLLSGLVPWGLLSTGALNGTQAIIGKIGLIQQVAFPREILVLLVFGEALVDMGFTFIALIVVNLLNGIAPNINFLFFFVLLFILACFVLGLMLFLSCLGLMVRDIPQLVAVALQLAFYLTPLIYPVTAIPERFQVLILLNPLAPIIEATREIIIYARPPDIVTLYYPLVIALVLLYVGHAFFKANEDRLTDFS